MVEDKEVYAMNLQVPDDIDWLPEHYLWLEVLLDGFRCAVEEKLQTTFPDFLKPRQKIYRDLEATNWLFSPKVKPGSFLWICDTLKINHRIKFIRNLYLDSQWAPERMGSRFYRKWHFPNMRR